MTLSKCCLYGNFLQTFQVENATIELIKGDPAGTDTGFRKGGGGVRVTVKS